MKIIKRMIKSVVTAFLLMFVCICIFLFVCTLDPDVTKGVKNLLYKEKGVVAWLEKTIERELLQIPEELRERTGYEAVAEERIVVKDYEEKPEIQSEIEETYESNEIFDTRIYPYYGMLGEQEKRAYHQMYVSVMEQKESFIPREIISVEEAENIFTAVYNDHPELFWLEAAYSCNYLESGRIVQINLQYNETANYIDEAQKAFDDVVNKAMMTIADVTDSGERERILHDWLIEHTEYLSSSNMNQSAYSALVNRETVCAGYARAFQYLMQKAGIPCYYCTGFAGEDHAWNIVVLEDRYFNVDATWDDVPHNQYNYYNKTDLEFQDTHQREGMSQLLPDCMG